MNDHQQRLNDLTRTLGICCPSPETRLRHNWRNSQQIDIWVKRDDLLHPIISGNKWRKLSHALAKITSANPIVSFGGGHSNHLHALAYCCYKLAVPFIAIVRGDYSKNLTPTLQDIIAWQGQIQFVDKKTYSSKQDRGFLAQLQSQYPQATIIPEGGSQSDAIVGVQSLLAELQNQYDLIIAPVASGATLAGLIDGLPETSCQVIGVAMLKGQGYLEGLVEGFLSSKVGHQTPAKWHIEHNYHHGGYAKVSPQLSQFCSQFEQTSGIPLEPVYSGKLFYALKQLVETNQIQSGLKVLAIHTGGLQGSRLTAQGEN